MGDMKYTVKVADFVWVRPCVKGGEDRRRDFRNWKEQMMCLLESQDVLGFVDGQIQEPWVEEKYKEWRRTDRLVKGWILESIGKDVLHAVSDKETARDVWLELHSIFKQQVEKNEGESDNGRSGDDSSSRSKKLVELYRALLRGKWDMETAKNNSTTVFSSSSETPLHVAVVMGKANHLVKNLVKTMSHSALAYKNRSGNTALHNAAMVGNTEAASALIEKCPNLLVTLDSDDQAPVQVAAMYNQRDTLECLISRHEADEEHKAFLFHEKRGLSLLTTVIFSNNIDIALELARKYPNLALQNYSEPSDESVYSALSVMAKMDKLFPRKETFNCWQTFIYHRIPLQNSTSEAGAHTTANASDIENLSSNSYSNSFQMIISGVGQKLELMIWHAIKKIVPKVKELREKKARHEQALQLVECLCDRILSELPENKALEIFEPSMMLAAKRGTSEVVGIIIRTFPSIIYHVDAKTGMDIFFIAAVHRFENVFKLINSISDLKYMFFNKTDNKDNNLLHICGKIAPPHRLNLRAGAALQMQRELQWFKEAEKFVHSHHRTLRNKGNETPQEVFTREHEKLKEEGERWMKDTANACTIAAALIATIVFAAAFTVPGGVESSTGVPLLLGLPVFNLFAVSDAVSFFTSITSLLMFLSILTSRYAEQDFLNSLPKRLAIGLFSLFLSIAFMLIAFGAALYLLFERDLAWFGLPVAVLACFPVTSFGMLQFPLLVDVTYSTYGPGIFGKKSDRLIFDQKLFFK